MSIKVARKCQARRDPGKLRVCVAVLSIEILPRFSEAVRILDDPGPHVKAIWQVAEVACQRSLAALSGFSKPFLIMGRLFYADAIDRNNQFIQAAARLL
ncbi:MULTISPECIES: hypothetical protein [unclassified Burkholderia]|uniref:hypothetical protein n=1 Tax=unclassified Burkholderia TaxID=2613784 RepID=UPI00158DE7F0|nr:MULTISPECIES: hypothetical protein [unclassified Burkholderia]